MKPLADVDKGITVFIAGDSTAANYAENRSPMAGWGQMLGSLFEPSVLVRNEARSGRSSKSFIEEGHIRRIEEAIGAGDYLLIQFGHNDQKSDAERHTEPDSTYPDFLRRYVDLARSKGAHPVLLTSVDRRKFSAAGELVGTHGQYPDAVRALAAEQRVPLLDVQAVTQEAYRRMGPEASKAWFVWLAPGEHPNYPDGVQDDTHFNETGALEVARLIAALMKEAGILLAHKFASGSGSGSAAAAAP
ncbi:Rhamnogalacturonan acetylesterase RhgT [Paenibacillus solanacearum]|uniref:Rhamnogalacturonan acetylesterase RhgT n=1 Tax=Paenibacillus solanacearum TaxID=2048548 RepID=A0A916KA58_9BACL|nr:rhamnogalacturonan acetylesterase [Paenibacillus solanacearum]CAG7649267.1 Rhamnogalacturonan acetylesterase RhgT [Paenibacillus solanacearum]